MNFRKMLMFAACVAAVATASADGNYLHLKTASGWEVLDLEQVDRLTFANGVMTASDANKNTIKTFDQASLEQMYFDDTAGVMTVSAEESEPSFQVSDNGRLVKMIQAGEFEVYSVAGESLVGIPGVKVGETINLSALPAGVAILKSGNYAKKVVLK